MLLKSDAIKEKKLIEELIADEEDLRRQHENFETSFRKQGRESALLSHACPLLSGFGDFGVYFFQCHAGDTVLLRNAAGRFHSL